MPGPATEPAESMPITIPDSLPRRSGGALSVTQDMEAVQIEPLAKPWTKRARIRTAAFGLHAKMTVATVIRTPDHSEIRRAPIRGTRTMHASDTNGTDAG